MKKILITTSFLITLIFGLRPHVYSCTPPNAPTNTTKSSNLTICFGTKTTLSAKGTGKLGWYTAPTGGTYLGKDTIFIIPVLTNSTTFYVQDSTCAASSSRTAITVTVKDRPKAEYSVPSLRCDKRDIQFTNLSTINTGTMSYIWNFGDGGVSYISDPIHQFANSAKKNVKLKVVSDFGCVDSMVKAITLEESPKADFNWGPACNLSNTDFTFTGTHPAGKSTAFNWNFNNEGTSTQNSPSKLFSTIGDKKITLTLTSTNGCNDTIIKTVLVKPQAKAQFFVNDACENDSAIFINKSIGPQTYIMTYKWKFGDGSNSTFESPKHLFRINGISQTFNVTLVAVVSGGCSDSTNLPVTVNALPKSDFTYTISGYSFAFKATQTGNTYYKWIYGNGVDSVKVKTVYTYPKAGQYNACLQVINAAGCFSQTCKSISVGCKANFTKSIDTSQKFKIFLINTSSNTSTTTYNWDFGDGGSSTSRNPTHKYNTFGKFKVCLTVKDSGCSSTFCDTLGLDSTGKLLKAGSFEVVIIEGQSGSVKNTKPKSDFKIYPNPANSKVTIDMNSSLIHYDKLEVVDAIGQVCLRQSIENGNRMLDLDLRMITPGLYFIKLSNDEDHSYLKMIKN